MPPSSKNINARLGPNAHRGRAPHQYQRSKSLQKRPEIESGGSRSEDMDMTSGTSVTNRFALLPNSEPAPGLKMEHAIQPIQSEFTFRHEKRFPTTSPTTAGFQAQQPSNPSAKSKIPTPPLEEHSSLQIQPNTVLNLPIAAHTTPTSPRREFKHPLAPPTPPDTPLSALSPPPQTILPTLPPFPPTGTSTPEYLDLFPQPEPLHPSLPSPSPLTISPPSTPRYNPAHLKPKVHLPPSNSSISKKGITPQRAAFFPASDPVANAVASGEERILVMAAEIAAASPTGRGMAGGSGSAKREKGNGKGGPVSRVYAERERGRKDVVLEEEEGSDGEWEFVW